MKKIIIFLLLILFSQEKKEYDLYLIKDEGKLLSYNDDTEKNMADFRKK